MPDAEGGNTADQSAFVSSTHPPAAGIYQQKLKKVLAASSTGSVTPAQLVLALRQIMQAVRQGLKSSASAVQDVQLQNATAWGALASAPDSETKQAAAEEDETGGAADAAADAGASQEADPLWSEFKSREEEQRKRDQEKKAQEERLQAEKAKVRLQSQLPDI